MTHNIAFVFPGQGSQYAGMAKDVAVKYPAARRVFDEIDDALGLFLSRLCFEGPKEELDLTENIQPAILVRWVGSVQKMISMGVKRFVEVGLRNVLTGLIKRIDPNVELINVSDVPSLEAFVHAY